jgi:RecJ-like exonuclease
MQNSFLLKLSLTLSILGILILLLISNFQTIKTINIQNISQNLLNQKVQIQGEIIHVKNYKDFQILTLADKTEKINIIINQKTNLTKNSSVKIIGRVLEYKGNLQVSADKILKD